jgi:type II secretory ATPase GspE/PulE/Tfp pilus assembly ATPase PilB-like protein
MSDPATAYTLGAAFRQKLASLDRANSRFVTELVDLVLAEARGSGASDIHLQPGVNQLEMRWRIDGVLHAMDSLPQAFAPNIVARLKVMADLLTYRTDVPQEGRIRGQQGEPEMRVSTFPTLYGEKAVVRLFASQGGFERLDTLGLPREILLALRRLLQETSGAILFSGPAGSGKTTTIYACLREIVAMSEGKKSLTTLEDPIEVAVAGVSQSQVNATAGFDLENGLRSLMRQDPDVIAVGEIRDRSTAEVAFQASLTGHLLLTTFHSGSAAGALGRLSDMGIEPYILRSGILAIVFQRLVRKLCRCAVLETDPQAAIGLPVGTFLRPVGCELCYGRGYHGRVVLAEMLYPDQGELGRGVLQRRDVDELERAAVHDGMVTRWHRGVEAIEAGLTTPSEVRRVLGLGDWKGS